MVTKPKIKKVEPEKPITPMPDNRHPIKKFFDKPGLKNILLGTGILGLLGMIGYWILLGDITLYSNAPAWFNWIGIIIFAIIWEYLVTLQADYEIVLDYKAKYLASWKENYLAKLLCIFLAITAMMALGILGGIVAETIFGLIWIWIYLVMPYWFIAIKIIGILVFLAIFFPANHLYMKSRRQKKAEEEELAAEMQAELEEAVIEPLVTMPEPDTPTIIEQDMPTGTVEVKE